VCDYGPYAYVSEWWNDYSAAYLAEVESYHSDPLEIIDTLAFYAGFVPGIDTLSDLWFVYRAWSRGDQVGMALSLGCLFAPIASTSYLKSAGRYGDDILGLAKRADDVPTGPGLRNVDDAADALRRADKTSIMESHHLLPVEYKQFFKSKGININSPEYQIRIDREVHKILHGKYVGGIQYMNWNKEWGKWIAKKGDAATASNVIQQMKTMMGRYGL